MNEQAERYIKLLKKNSDRVAVVVMFLFLGAMLLVWQMEQGGITDLPQSTTAVIEDTVAKNPAWATIKTMAAPQDMRNYPAIQQVRQTNMFDYKSVKGQQEIERTVKLKMGQAEEAEKAGRKPEATALAEEVLKLKPLHKPARDLLNRLKPAATPAAGEGGAAPAATPAAAAGASAGEPAI